MGTEMKLGVRGMAPAEMEMETETEWVAMVELAIAAMF